MGKEPASSFLFEFYIRCDIYILEEIPFYLTSSSIRRKEESKEWKNGDSVGEDAASQGE